MKTPSSYLLPLYTLMLLLASVIGAFTVVINYTKGVYTSTQDTIVIPLIAISGIFVALLALVSFQMPLYIRRKKNKAANMFVTIASLLATILSSALLIGSIHYWYIPDHIQIGGFYLVTLCAYLAFQLQLYKKRI